MLFSRHFEGYFEEFGPFFTDQKELLDQYNQIPDKMKDLVNKLGGILSFLLNREAS